MLSALVAYYDQIARDHPNEVAPIGWSSARVGCELQLDVAGRIMAIIPIKDRQKMMRVVPMQEKRAVNIAANFLCDNSTYILGVDNKGKPERTAKCFQAARDLHHKILDGVDSACAQSIIGFFDTWSPTSDSLSEITDDNAILSGKNIVFKVEIGNDLADPMQDEAIREAWKRYLGTSESSPVMRCLVTGDIASIARLHPSIRGVYGAQSSGASLVSFNARAFESYGHDNEQGRNAPVSERAAQAYTTALNYLLSRPEHHTRLGDTTIVYWAEHKDDENAQLFSSLLGGGLMDENNSSEDAISFVNATMTAIAHGVYRDVEGIDPDSTFYILGIAPSAARLVIKFFFKDTFGAMLDNLGKHYRRSDVIHGKNQAAFLTPYQLLREVENPKAKKPVVAPVLAGPLLKAMLLDAPYPQALYANALLRIHATQSDPDTYTRKVSRGRASIIRAYLIKNCTKKGYDERGLTVSLNQQRNEPAYNLGRAFAILEQIQEEANGRASLTNRYYNAASTTPLAVFPTLIRLSNAHLAKIERTKPGLAYYLAKQLREVLGEDRVYVFPKRLNLEEQGDFALGTFHQTSKRYERNTENNSESVTTDLSSEE